jgi:ribonuclease BN (tRNA processing enzyme)
MRLTVLGGAAACPNPGQGSSAYLLDVAGQSFLLDCGPNTILELRKHREIDQVGTILISHVHSDHTLDLVPYRYGLKYIPGLSDRKIPLWMPPEGTAFLGRVANAFAMGTEGSDDFFDSLFEIHEYAHDGELSFDDVRVRLFRTNHPVPCWAMRVESSEGTLVYMADTGPQDNLVEIASGADILICEGTEVDHSKVDGIDERPHISAAEAGCIAREAGVGTFVLTHIWESLGPQNYVAAAQAS